nr:hypothetical protein [Saccharomonospora glauca]
MDAVLLGLEQVERDRVGVVGLEELDLLGFELRLLRGEAGALVAGGCGQGVEHLPEHGLDAVCVVVADPDMLVGGLDPVLDAVCEERAALAGVLLVAAAGAGEVVVEHTLVVAGPLEREPLTAGTVDRAFEVVIVLLGLVANDVVLPQDGLHLLERLGGDQRLVRALVGDAAEGDDALVIGVRQHLVQQLRGDRPLRVRGRGAGGEAAGFEFAGELGQRPVAGGVGGEREPHMLGPFGVGLDVAHLAALRVDGADVQVAQRCPVRGAAHRRLLHEPLGDLLGEVEAVELGDRGHDAVHEHPRGGLIDVLGDRHERDPLAAQGGVDDRVIEPVPGDPVDLVDDAVPHGVGREVIQHLLECLALDGLGGLAGLDELGHDHRTELVGLAFGGLTLRRDRQAFFEPVAGGLVLGRDPQVGDRGNLPVGKGDVGGGMDAVRQRTQDRQVDPCGQIKECHGRDSLSDAHPPQEGSGVGAVWLSRQWLGVAYRTATGSGSGLEEPVAPMLVDVHHDSTVRCSGAAEGRSRPVQLGCRCRPRGARRAGGLRRPSPRRSAHAG